jgi:hypothetical protein
MGEIYRKGSGINRWVNSTTKIQAANHMSTISSLPPKANKNGISSPVNPSSAASKWKKGDLKAHMVETFTQKQEYK